VNITISQRLLCRFAAAFDRATLSRYGRCENNPEAIRTRKRPHFIPGQSLRSDGIDIDI